MRHSPRLRSQCVCLEHGVTLHVCRTFRLCQYDHFLVPRGVRYFIENTSKSRIARIVYMKSV